MSLKAGTKKVSLHLYLNNPWGLQQATVYEDVVERLRSRQKQQRQTKTDTQESAVENDKPKDPSQALGFCWSLSLTPDSKIAEKKVALLEMNRKLKDLPCLSDVSSTLETPDLLLTKSTLHSEQTDEHPQSDIGQRKVSEKLAEWLDEYNLVTQRQHVYLRKIHDLRQGLLHQEDKNLHRRIKRIRQNPNHKNVSRRYPVYTLTKMEEKAVNRGPEPFPNRPCLLNDKSKAPKILMAPSLTPRKLAPIVKRVQTDKYNKDNTTDLDNNKLPKDKEEDAKFIVSNKCNKGSEDLLRPEMSSMRTEYEPFESIARRNNLNLNQLFTTSISNRMINRRLPVQMTRVSIIDEGSDEDYATPANWNQLTINNSKKFTTPNRMKQTSHSMNRNAMPAVLKNELVAN